MDWLLPRRKRLEAVLARRRLDHALILRDVTSSYFEGRCCPLARRGHSGKLQTGIGLLCNRDGCPVTVGVFDGNTADPCTVARQITKIRARFDLDRWCWWATAACSPRPVSVMAWRPARACPG
jgi:hypothetical protein